MRKIVSAHSPQNFVKEKWGGAVTVDHSLHKQSVSKKLREMSSMGTPVPLITKSMSVLVIPLPFLIFFSSPLSYTMSLIRISEIIKWPSAQPEGRLDRSMQTDGTAESESEQGNTAVWEDPFVKFLKNKHRVLRCTWWLHESWLAHS